MAAFSSSTTSSPPAPSSSSTSDNALRRERRTGNRLHRAHELEVVVVGIGEGRDPIGRLTSDVVWLADDFGACSPELLKVPLYVFALDVEDKPARRRVLALDLVMGADRYPSAADLPAVIAPFRHGRLPGDLRLLIDGPREI